MKDKFIKIIKKYPNYFKIRGKPISLDLRGEIFTIKKIYHFSQKEMKYSFIYMKNPTCNFLGVIFITQSSEFVKEFAKKSISVLFRTYHNEERWEKLSNKKKWIISTPIYRDDTSPKLIFVIKWDDPSEIHYFSPLFNEMGNFISKCIKKTINNFFS